MNPLDKIRQESGRFKMNLKFRNVFKVRVVIWKSSGEIGYL